MMYLHMNGSVVSLYRCNDNNLIIIMSIVLKTFECVILFSRTYVCVYGSVCTEVCVCVCMDACVWKCIYIYMCVCVYVRICICPCKYIYVCVYVCMCVYVCALASHTHVHPHVCIQRPPCEYQDDSQEVYHH